MTFGIDLDAVQGLPLLLDRAAEATLRGREYVDRYTGIDFADSILGSVLDAHRHLVATVTDALTTFAGPIAQGGAAAIREAIAWYSQTDHALAALIDEEGYPGPGAAMAEVGVYATSPGIGQARFADAVDAQREYRPPGDHLDGAPGFSWEVLDVVGPQRLTGGIVWEATSLATSMGLLDRPIDVEEEYVRPFAGDWPGLLRCAEVWRHVADVFRDVDANIRSNVDNVSTVWTGNAADACRLYLARAGQWAAAVARCWTAWLRSTSRPRPRWPS